MSKLSVNTIAHTGGTTAMTVDSSGRILKPALPAFRVGLVNSQSETSTDTFETVEWDEGTTSESDFCFTQGGFSWNNGVVTVPVAGIYSFSMALRIDNVNGQYYVVGRITKNNDNASNKELYVIDGQADPNYINLTGTTLYKLAAGDNIRVTVFLENDSSSGWLINNGSTFSGHLLG